MKALPSPIFFPQPKKLHLPLKSNVLKLNSVTISSSCKAASAIPAPPPNFNFKNEILDISTAAIAETHPELLDLAKNGTLVLIKKSQYGPVPPWRSEFVEPEDIWIIGTTHISRESASDVERVIRAVRPDNVVVELCRSRQFRAARNASEEIGAQLVLGDRPIEITLERAWNSLKWKEKLSLITSVIRGITSSDLSKATLEEPRVDDSSFQLYEQLSFSYPSLLPPLIYERDTFLAWSLKRSKAVNNSKKVVGVIGKGHMNGVIYSLMSDTGNLRFKDLAGKRPGNDNGWAGKIVKDLLRDTIIGVVLWLVYEQFKSML
ncbi:putative protein, contains TraB domain [Handroanthus impetiginosus]|uniref:TraB domain-containing protein n=1 Tax=Handroanthus impetiginosus TaxID=429701 RepID=A0A2G9FWW0_9LAMI|nr:putative protein, contains TraB domain [Handroanthus impetiginosus]